MENSFDFHMTMRKSSILIIVTLIVFLIEYWNTELKYRTYKSGVIWPLAIGNNWIYRGYQSPEYNIEVIGTREIKGDEVFVVKFSSKFELYYQYFMNRKKGLFSYGGIGKQNLIEYGLLKSPQLIFGYPSFAGNYYGVLNEKMTLESIDEKVTTPYGSFKCYKYHNERPDGAFAIVWLAPNIGMVKEVGCIYIKNIPYCYRLLLKYRKANNLNKK